MEDSFENFNDYLQTFIWEMNNFSYFIACEVWPEGNFNTSSKSEARNHFWNKFIECDREPSLFYSKLDLYNREKLYKYIAKEKKKY